MEQDEFTAIGETNKAIEQLKSGKAGGEDIIPLEIWKHGIPALHSKLCKLFACSWELRKLPQELRDAVIITLHKKEGDRTSILSHCSEHFQFLFHVKKNGGLLCSPSQKNPRNDSAGNTLTPLKKTFQKDRKTSELTRAQQTWCLFYRNIQIKTTGITGIIFMYTSLI